MSSEVQALGIGYRVSKDVVEGGVSTGRPEDFLRGERERRMEKGRGTE